jgi:methyl-accepting chemotaxis protein
VAEEVRKLAEDAQSAAGEISTLIAEMQAAQEIAASAGELASTAERLERLVSRFRV